MASNPRVALIAALLSFAGCDSEKKPEPSAAKPTETEAPKKAPVADDDTTALAAKAKQRVAIDGLGVSIEVPEGTTVTPPRDADEGKRRANLKQGAFMVNVFTVDEYSAPNFAKANEVYKDDKLVESFRADATPTGWILFKEVFSGMYKENRFEVNVRTEVGGKKWDCETSAPSKSLAELALAACQTLTTGSEAQAPVADAPAPSKPSAKPTAAKPAPAKPAASSPTAKPGSASVQGSLPKEVIARVVRTGAGKARTCYERALATNPKLEVTVTTAFVIGPNGNVMAASTTGGDAKLTGCVAAVFQGMQFPAPLDGRSVRVAYPFHFKPS